MGHGCRKGGNRSNRSRPQRESSDDLDVIGDTLGNQSALDALSQYSQAYENARFYHKTYEDNLDGIREEGLDPKYGGTGFTQMSGFGNDEALNKGTVHLSNQHDVNQTYGGVQLRAFLPPDRTKVNAPKGRQGQTAWEGIPTEQITLDPEHGLGAWVTREPIPPQQLQFPDQDVPNDESLGIIGQHMKLDDLEQLRELHRQAREQKRLSTGDLKPKSITDYKDKFHKRCK
jgi:hypothetical protein